MKYNLLNENNVKLTLILTLLTILALNIYCTYALGNQSLVSNEVIHSAYLVSIAPPWGTIDEGVKECVINAIDTAEKEGKAVILEVDSYGGYLDAGFAIGDKIASSNAPVIAYVSGGKALSAATLIILPAHIIALSPHSIMGAMQPISYNPLTGSYVFVNESKIVNPIVEKAVTYAKLRGRNATAAELFVKKNLVLDAKEAVKEHVADLIAYDLNDLLRKIRGYVVNVNGRNVTLEITEVSTFSCGVRSRLISVFSNPMVNSIMMTIGVLGMIFAILSGKLPILPIPILFLLLGLLGTGFSPNLISLFMILLGAILLGVELFVTPGFGILGITGIIFLAVGVALIPSAAPTAFAPPPNYIQQFRVLAIGIASGLGTFTGFVIYKVVQAKRRRPTYFTMAGKVGKAVDDIPAGGEGFVIVEGEYWKAVSKDDIKKGDAVVVEGMEGTRLVVRRLDRGGS